MENSLENNARTNIAEQVNDRNWKKKKSTSFTLSRLAIKQLHDEAKRLNTNRSFLVGLMIQNFMECPILEGEKGRLKSPKD